MNGETLLAEAIEMKDEIVENRRAIHRAPEVGAHLPQTVQFVEEKLRLLGYEPRELGGGVVAELTGEDMGRCILLRADMDALKVREKTDLPFRSENGSMHACGHDFHITAGIGTAIWLQEHKDELCGTVRFFFQPGEESSLGAWKVLETTALDSVTRVWGFHSDPTNLVNAIGIREGAVAAAVDRFVITITGVGCHGAHPDDGVDPIPAAAAMVQAFQTIVTRNINPFHPTLISVTRLEAGNTWNVIPQTAQLEGTVRTMDRQDRCLFEKRLKVIAEQTASAYGASAEVEWIPGPPAVCNDAEMAAFAKETAEAEGFQTVPEEQSLGGDDFSFYMEKVPGCYIKIGIGKGATIHQPTFQVDPAALMPAVRYLSRLLLRWGEEKG